MNSTANSGGTLAVYTWASEEWVIAASPEDAEAVYLATGAESMREPSGRFEWEALPSDKMLTMHDIDGDGGGDVRVTCAEWVVRQGRSYLGSANY